MFRFYQHNGLLKLKDDAETTVEFLTGEELQQRRLEQKRGPK